MENKIYEPVLRNLIKCHLSNLTLMRILFKKWFLLSKIQTIHDRILFSKWKPRK
jgi:hypothetical protein